MEYLRAASAWSPGRVAFGRCHVSENLSRFTPEASRVLVSAHEEARALKQDHIGTEHLLLGLLREREGVAARVLESVNITVDRVRAQVVRGSAEDNTTDDIPFTPQAKRVLQGALTESFRCKRDHLDTQHILLALAGESQGFAARILLSSGADMSTIRSWIKRIQSSDKAGETGGAALDGDSDVGKTAAARSGIRWFRSTVMTRPALLGGQAKDTPPRLDDLQLARVMDVAYAFASDLGLLLAGYDPPFVMATGQVRGRLRTFVEPFLASGWALRPNFGEIGEVMTKATPPVEAVVLFEDRSVRESQNVLLVPNPRRWMRLRLQFDPELDLVTQADLEAARLATGLDPDGGAAQALAALLRAPTEPVQSPAGNFAFSHRWAPCEFADGCNGSRLLDSSFCLAHVDDETRRVHLEDGRGRIDLRGAPISGALLKEVLAARARRDQRTRRLDFDHAVFLDRVSFEDANFYHTEITFESAEFQRGADFTRARFEGVAAFSGARFLEGATFWAAKFEGPALFERVTFQGEADFHSAQFYTGASFELATFLGPVAFDSVTFRCGVNSILTEVYFGAATFAEATFEHAVSLGPLLAAGDVSFDRTIFKEDAELDAYANVVSCAGTRFRGRAELSLAHCEVFLDRAQFAETVVLKSPRDDRARLVSVRGADLEGLVVRDVDLRRCRFLGATNADKMSIQGDSTFQEAPSLFGIRGRRIIVEEAFFRLSQVHRSEISERDGMRIRFSTRGVQSQPWWKRMLPTWESLPDAEDLIAAAAQEPALRAADLTAVYRALRKGREDARDIPVAGDFYYGEMAMRREAVAEDRRGHRQTLVGRDPAEDHNGSHAAFTERALLDAYWLTCGYLLRPLRAVCCFGVLVVVGSVLLGLVGFRGHESIATAFAVGFGSAANLQIAGAQAQSATGHAITIALHVIGSALLLLALASVRGWLRR